MRYLLQGGFFYIWTTLGHFWTTFEDFGKTGLGVMSASSLVLSSLLLLLSTVHLPAQCSRYSIQWVLMTDETGTREHSNANFYNHYYHYYYCLLYTFLAVQDSSIGDIVSQSLSHSVIF